MIPDKSKLSIRNWPISTIKAELAQARILLAKAVVFSSKHGYQRMHRSQNKELFFYLDRLGFFDFHVTNSGRTCYIHQAQIYLRNTKGGWFHYFKGEFFCAKDDLEVHHLDSNPINNDSENLCYVTPTENLLLSALCGVKYYGKAALNATIQQLRLCPRFVMLEKLTRQLTFERLARQSFSVFSAA